MDHTKIITNSDMKDIFHKFQTRSNNTIVIPKVITNSKLLTGAETVDDERVKQV